MCSSWSSRPARRRRRLLSSTLARWPSSWPAVGFNWMARARKKASESIPTRPTLGRSSEWRHKCSEQCVCVGPPAAADRASVSTHILIDDPPPTLLPLPLPLPRLNWPTGRADGQCQVMRRIRIDVQLALSFQQGESLAFESSNSVVVLGRRLVTSPSSRQLVRLSGSRVFLQLEPKLGAKRGRAPAGLSFLWRRHLDGLESSYFSPFVEFVVAQPMA